MLSSIILRSFSARLTENVAKPKIKRVLRDVKLKSSSVADKTLVGVSVRREANDRDEAVFDSDVLMGEQPTTRINVREKWGKYAKAVSMLGSMGVHQSC